MGVVFHHYTSPVWGYLLCVWCDTHFGAPQEKRGFHIWGPLPPIGAEFVTLYKGSKKPKFSKERVSLGRRLFAGGP